jgi:EAL domain-containing protein (putative c-di-GMP-specific phosphodiesterase class I)
VPARRPIRALVVDDDAAFCQAVIGLLRQIGVNHVEAAGDGQEAVRLITTASEPFDVVLCDLHMPIEDGVVVLRRLAEHRDRSPLILMSGEDPLTLDAAGRLGAHYGLRVLGTLEKPFSLAQLERMLSRLHQPLPPAEAAELAPLEPSEIEAGLDEGRFEVWFEPQISLRTGRIAGVEALLRFRHWTNGLVMPARFIRQAEQHGQIDRLTILVLERVAARCQLWHRAGHTMPVSINLSAATLRDPACPDTMAAVCARYHLRPSGIVFELTESTAVDDPGVLLDVMTRLRLKGFGLALDDFGTGYASLQQLHRLPFRQLKIDRWFVQEASRDDRSRRIIEHSLNLASQLGLSTVAEGVDSEAGLELMTRLGCDTAQGYFIARPMPAADVTRWIDAR